jgi:uncharacterized repeat protein (TIGR01451 family)
VKSAPEMSAEGHEISYTITVTNEGDVSLYNVMLYDTIRGSMEQCNVEGPVLEKSLNSVYSSVEIPVGYLGVGASKEIPYSFTVPDEWGYNFVCNEVVVWAQPGPSSLWCGHGACPWFDETNDDRWFSASDCVCTFIAKPAIKVDKVGPPCVDPKIGAMMFTVTIENTGNIMIKDLYVWDNATGNYYAYIPNANLDVNQIKTIQIPYNLGEWTEADGNWFDNVVEVRGDVFGNGHSNVWDDGTWSVHVDMPNIFLDKNVVGNVDGAMPGDIITFTFFIKNTGNVALTDIMLYDEQLGDEFPMAIGDLAVDESVTVSYAYTIPIGASGVLTNFAQVYGYSVCCDVEAFSQDDVVYFVADPEIEVSKEAKIETLLVDETAHWEITVHNSGNVALTGVYLDDSLAADGTFDYNGWDFTLAVDETVVVDFYFLVTEGSWDANDMVCNEVVANGYYNNDVYSDTAFDCVFIAQPSMTVEKTAVSEVCYGDVITWTVTVTNTGNVPLYDIIVNDPLTGIVNLEVVDYLGLEGSVVFYPTYDTSSAKLTDPVVNHVDVAADVFGDDANFIYGDDTSSVNVAFVYIAVVKTAPEIAVRGETITYIITVYNYGNRDATIFLNDELLGLVDYEIFVEVGESWSSVDRIGFSYTIPCNVGEVLENIVTVETTYNECCGDKDMDTASTHIMQMSIKVLKTSQPSAVPGETILITFDVWNDGEVTLSNIRLDDETLPELSTPVGPLAPMGTPMANHAVWTVPYTIPVDFLNGEPYAWLDNHVMVYGTYNGVETYWGAGWSIWVHQPGCNELPQ